MTIERCDKCGKAFMSQSEVQRHKMYEHPVPVSPFEEKRFDSDLSKNNTSSNMNMEDVQKMTSDVVATDKSSSNNDITTIGGGQMRKVPFRTFRF
jgi:transcriptional regulator NrdR family protein